jgi:ATP-dependent Lhr-like helicase
MEDSGWIRRGMFVAGLGAAQFAMPSAVDVLRSLRSDVENNEVIYLAATDPANPYGATLPWPQVEANQESETAGTHHGMARASGAGVILVNGMLAAFLRKRNPAMRVFLPDADPERSTVARSLSGRLAQLALERQARRTGLLIGTINEAPAREHFLARFLEEAGFINTALGYQMRRVTPTVTPIRTPPDPEPLDIDEADISEMG